MIEKNVKIFSDNIPVNQNTSIIIESSENDDFIILAIYQANKEPAQCVIAKEAISHLAKSLTDFAVLKNTKKESTDPVA